MNESGQIGEKNQETDSDLVRRFCQEGDREALALLFERHRELAYRIAFDVLGNRADAEDATQNAFLNLWAYAPRMREQGSLTGLVARMALRAAQRLARAEGRRSIRETTWAAQEARHVAPDPVDQAAEREVRRRVQEALNSLPDSYRLPILLHYLEGLSVEETAKVLGISHAAARNRLWRGLGKLRANLQRHAPQVGIPALIALLRPHPSAVASPALAARVRDVLLSQPSPALSAVPGLGAAALKLKVAAVTLAVAATMGSVVVLHSPRPPAPPVGRARVVPPSTVSAGSASAPVSIPVEKPNRMSTDASTGKPVPARPRVRQKDGKNPKGGKNMKQTSGTRSNILQRGRRRWLVAPIAAVAPLAVWGLGSVATPAEQPTHTEVARAEEGGAKAESPEAKARRSKADSPEAKAGRSKAESPEAKTGRSKAESPEAKTGRPKAESPEAKAGARKSAEASSKAAKMFQRYDANKDGKVTFEEWLKMKEGAITAQRRAQEQAAFNQVDANRDGALSQAEFEKWLSVRSREDEGGAKRKGPRDGEGAARPGPRDGEGPAWQGPRDGEGSPRSGPRDPG